MKIFSGLTPSSSAFLRAGSKLLPLAEIGGEGDDLAAISRLQPFQDDRSVEAAGIGEDDALHFGLGLGHSLENSESGRSLTARDYRESSTRAQPRLRRIAAPKTAASAPRDDDQHDQRRQNDVREIMAAESHPQQAGDDAKQQRAGDDRTAARAAARDSPARPSRRPPTPRPRRTSNSSRHSPSKRYQGRNSNRPPNSRGLDRARTMGVILQTEIDDKARPDRHRRDEKDELAPGRRISGWQSPAPRIA